MKILFIEIADYEIMANWPNIKKTLDQVNSIIDDIFLGERPEKELILESINDIEKLTPIVGNLNYHAKRGSHCNDRFNNLIELHIEDKHFDILVHWASTLRTMKNVSYLLEDTEIDEGRMQIASDEFPYLMPVIEHCFVAAKKQKQGH